jgi:hypothetical protein
MNQLHRNARGVAEKTPHARDIIGFRDILAYGYAELDHMRVYQIAIVHAPALLSAVQEALKAFPPPDACSTTSAILNAKRLRAYRRLRRRMA